MDPKEFYEAALANLYMASTVRFGPAVKGYWFYDDDDCPGCRRPVDFIKIKGQNVLSLNAFIYRKRGILIGYLLCGHCARQIFEAAKKNPMKQIPLHGTIEQNLIEAYLRSITLLSV